MAETYKHLASGQLPNSSTALYTAPGSTKCVGPSIWLHNTNSTDEAVELSIHDGVARIMWQGTLSAGASANIDFGRVVLETGYKIQGNTTTAAKVNYYLSGVELT